MIGYFGVLHALHRLELSLDEPWEGMAGWHALLNERGKKDWWSNLMKLKNMIYSTIYIFVIYCNIIIYMFFQESYDHRRYLSLISGVYPGYFVFRASGSLDPQGFADPSHRRCRRSAQAMKAQGSWVMRGWWNVTTSVPTNWWWIRHFWKVMFILYIKLLGLWEWCSSCFCKCFFWIHVLHIFNKSQICFWNIRTPMGCNISAKFQGPGPKTLLNRASWGFFPMVTYQWTCPKNDVNGSQNLDSVGNTGGYTVTITTQLYREENIKPFSGFCN